MSNIRTSSFFVLKPLLIKEFLHLEEQIDQLFAKPKKLKVELKELIQEMPIPKLEMTNRPSVLLLQTILT